MRLYLTNATAGFTPTTRKGTWSQTTGFVTKALSATPSGVATKVNATETSALATFTVLQAVFVSDAMTAAGTLSGLAQLFAAVREDGSANNDFYRIHAYVTVGSTDTARGTLYATGTPTSPAANPTTSISSNQIYSSSTASNSYGQRSGPFLLTPVACSVGDRIVVEIGFIAANTSSTGARGADLNYGGTTTALVEHGLASGGSGWVEFGPACDALFGAAPAITADALTAPTFGGVAASQLTTTATSIVATMPAGVAPGDFLIMAACNTSPSAMTQASWTKLADIMAGDDIQAALWTKLASASEPASYTVSGPSGATAMSAAIIRIPAATYGGLRGWSVSPTASDVSTQSGGGFACQQQPPLTGLRSNDRIIKIICWGSDEGTITVTPAYPSTGTWNQRLLQGAARPTSGNFGCGITVVDDVGTIAEAAATVGAGQEGQSVVFTVALYGVAAAVGGRPPGQFFPFLGHHGPDPDALSTVKQRLWTPGRRARRRRREIEHAASLPARVRVRP